MAELSQANNQTQEPATNQSIEANEPPQNSPKYHQNGIREGWQDLKSTGIYTEHSNEKYKGKQQIYQADIISINGEDYEVKENANQKGFHLQHTKDANKTKPLEQDSIKEQGGKIVQSDYLISRAIDEKETLQNDITNFLKGSIARDVERIQIKDDLKKSQETTLLPQAEKDLRKRVYNGKLNDLDIKDDQALTSLFAGKSNNQSKKIINMLNDPKINQDIGQKAEKQKELVKNYYEKNKPQTLEQEAAEKEDEREKINKTLQNGLKDIPQSIQKAQQALAGKEKADNELKEHVDLMNEYTTPKKIVEFASDSKNLDDNQNIKTSIGILKEQDENNKAIEDLQKKQLELLEEKRANQPKPTPEAKPDKSQEQKDWDKRYAAMEKQMDAQMKKLQDNKEKLESDFQSSVENVVNAKDLGDLLTKLKEMDKALALILKEQRNEYALKAEQRERRIEMAFESPEMKKTVAGLLKELYDNGKKVDDGLEMMEKEKRTFVELQEILNKEKTKGKEIDIKDYEKVTNILDRSKTETPLFEKRYPRMHKQADEFLIRTKNKIMGKVKEPVVVQKDISRSM